MSINVEIGRRIRSQREKMGIRQLDIANLLQVSPQAVSKWENGENAPDISLLVPLSKILNVTTDWLLGYHNISDGLIDASIFISSIEGSTKKMEKMTEKESVIWKNGFLQQLTESILIYNGVPIKYMGDGVLALFSGPNHQERAILSSISAKKIVEENLQIGLHSGSVYAGSLGYKEYASLDISGKVVNTTFRILATQSETGINASMKIATEADYDLIKNIRIEILKGIDTPTKICEIIIK